MTLMLPLYANSDVSYSNAFFTPTPCASSCGSVSPSTDCGTIVYEIDEFPGSSANSTSAGDGSGEGCRYYGYGSPLVLGAGSGSSYTFCTEYTASSSEAAYMVYLNAFNSSCVSRSISVHNANSCSTSGISVVQPVASLPATASGLIPGNDYVVCHTYTENGCVDDFSSSIIEICMSVSEASYCSSNPDPRNLTQACSGESFQLDLENNCTSDPDLGVLGGLPGFAAFYYMVGGQYTNFPPNLRAGDISTDANIRFFDESNVGNGGGCSPINIDPKINTSCTPLNIPIGIVGVDVNSIASPPLRILPDCKIIEATLRIHPQLTSQVTGSTVQLLSPTGAVCETYSTNGGGGGGTVTLTPTPASGIVSIGGFQLSVTGTYGNVGTLPTPPGKTPATNTGGGGGTNAPCVTAGTAGNRDYDGNTGITTIPHTIEVNDDGDYVITYEQQQSIPNRMVAYPNPAQNQLFFNTEQDKPYTVDVYDTFGKQVFHGQTVDGQPLDIAHLPSGLYTYALNNEEQALFKHGKWVKQ